MIVVVVVTGRGGRGGCDGRGDRSGCGHRGRRARQGRRVVSQFIVV